MAIEFERKFLVNPTNLDAIVSGIKPLRLEQGYLMEDEEKCIRIRIINNIEGYHTYKSKVGKGKSIEIEYEIPMTMANELYDRCATKIAKNRYIIPFGHPHLKIELDIFDNGLIMAEVELRDEEDSIWLDNNLPSWFIQEVTGNPQYFNANLAKGN